MSQPNPFDELGRILAEGGEIAIARAIASGFDSNALFLLFSNRFPGLSEAERFELQSFAERMLSAGEAITSGPLESMIDIDAIPVNANLYGDDPAGRRLRYIGEFYREETDRWYEVRVDFADLPSLEEAFEAVEQEARDVRERYPKAFGGNGGKPFTIGGIRITAGERRY